MESDDDLPNIPRHPKPRVDEEPPDPDPDADDHDDLDDPDDLPNTSTFTQPRTGAQSLTDQASIPYPPANEDKRSEEPGTGKSNIELN